jgi:hypothetical protein
MFMKLGLDVSGVESGAAQAKKATAGIGSTSKAIFTGVAVGAGVAFATMTKGAVEMERAQGDFQAATGRSREEAVAFSRDMNGLVGNANTVGLSFDQLTKTGTAVADQFQLVGEEGTKLTNGILGYAKVVKADGVTATHELEDALAAYGLGAEHAIPLTDQLIASHQRFGTDAGPRSLTILREMAPALQAANADLDDGVALLNLFETAGFDAGQAQRGLNKAVQELKPGETLDDLIAKVTAVEDPTERAQLAMELFGTRSGVGLANALRPGITGLDEFKVTAEDAAGAGQKASEDMMTTGDRIRAAGEKLLAGARDIGSQFGPALMGLSTMGTLLAPMATKGNLILGQLATKLLPAALLAGATTGAAQGEGHVVAATGTQVVGALFSRISAMAIPLAPAGTTVGTAVGSAMTVGMVLAIPLAVGALAGALAYLWVEAMDRAKHQVENDPASVTPADLFQGRAPGWAVAKVKVATEMQGIGRAALDAFNAEWKRGLEAGMMAHDPALLESARQAGLAAGEAAGEGTAEGMHRGWQNRNLVGVVTDDFHAILASIDAGRDNVVDGWQRMGADLLTIQTNNRRQMLEEARALGLGIPGEVGRGMMQESRQIVDSAAALREILENGLTPEAQANIAIGKKHIRLVREGMASEIPGAKQTALEMAIAAIRTIDQAADGAPGQRGLKAIGIYYDMLLANGLTEAEARVALKAAGVSDAVVDAMVGPGVERKLTAGAWGLANAWANAFSGQISARQAGVIRKLEAIGGAFIGHSPPRFGPLRELPRGAERAFDSWADAAESTVDRRAPRIVGRLRQIGNALTGLGPGFGGGHDLAMAGAGVTINGDINITIPVQGDGEPAKIGEAARRGVLEALDEYIAGALSNAHVRFTTEPAS